MAVKTVARDPAADRKLTGGDYSSMTEYLDLEKVGQHQAVLL